MKERIKSLDLLKIIAIFLVIYFHIVYNLGSTKTRWIGYIGVSLFFIISGYSLKKNYPNLEKFSFKWIQKRLIKIISLYYPFLILLAFLFNKQIYEGNIFGHLFSHFFFINPLFKTHAYSLISSAWFLTPLICFYIFYPYLNKFISKNQIYLIIAFIPMVIIRFIEGAQVYTSFNPIFFLGEFCFGIALANNKKIIPIISSLMLLLINPIMWVPFPIFYFTTKFKLKFLPTKPLNFLSNNTLILFLLHESFIQTILGRWTIFNLNKITSLIILTASSLITIFLINQINKILLTKQLKLKLKQK